MPTMKQCLFGGAVFAAGLTAHAADPDSIIVEGPYGVSTFGVALIPGYGYELIETFDPCVDDTNWDIVLTDKQLKSVQMAIKASDEEVFGYSDSSVDCPGDLNYGSALAYVRTLVDRTVTLVWDLEQDGGCAILAPITFQILEGVWLPGPQVGSIEVSLPPGDYVFAVRTEAMGGNKGSASISWAQTPACSCDLDGNGALNFDDIDIFVAGFIAGNLTADCDGNGTLNFDDIDCFVACFLGGCP